jgi:dihydropteroate synthase
MEARRFLVMGVVNVTPDSFSDGGRFLDPASAIAHGVRLAEEGAHILDLGAESSRPGSDPVSEEEERRRLLPVIEGLRAALPDMPLSVDTTKASVAAAALDAGADLVNDISAGVFDPRLIPLCAQRAAPLVLMHSRGEPKTMQDAPHYDDCVAQVVAELRTRMEAAEAAGLGPGQIMVDPGFGFAKRAEDNLALIAHLEALTCLGYPILVGASRKSTIGVLTGAPVDQRLPGTLALHTAALLKGASILRVHDVREHAQALACAGALL